MRKRYRATLQALNDECIGRQAHGCANLEVTDDDALQIRIEMSILREQLLKRYGTDVFNLDNAVMYVDGVQSDVLLPKTVMSDLDKEKPYLTLPIAVGKLRKVMG